MLFRKLLHWENTRIADWLHALYSRWRARSRSSERRRIRFLMQRKALSGHRTRNASFCWIQSYRETVCFKRWDDLACQIWFSVDLVQSSWSCSRLVRLTDRAHGQILRRKVKGAFRGCFLRPEILRGLRLFEFVLRNRRATASRGVTIERTELWINSAHSRLGLDGW